MNSPVRKIPFSLPFKQLFRGCILQTHLNRLTYLHNSHYTIAMSEIVNKPNYLHRHMLKCGDLWPRQIFRTFAKKTIVKESKSGKGHKAKIFLTDDEMLDVIRIDLMRSQMQNILDRLKDAYVNQLSVRTSSGSIENLQVTIEGDEIPLQEIAQIHKKSQNLIVINLANCPEGLKPTLEALQHSQMNLNPQQEGTMIHIAIPKVTREHRESLVKSAKTLFNKSKDDLREIQNHFIKDAKNKKADFSEDLIFNVQSQIRQIGDQYSTEGENMLTVKQKELMGEL